MEYTKAIELNPTEVRFYVDRGLVYRTAGKIPEAMADFTKAIELGPKNELGYLERGRTELGQNQFDTALADLTKAIELNPNDMVAFERRGSVYHSLRKWDEAIADYTVAITKDPTNAMALRKRADTYYSMGQFAKAVPDLEAAQKLQPDDPDIAQNLQHVRARDGHAPAGRAGNGSAADARACSRADGPAVKDRHRRRRPAGSHHNHRPDLAAKKPRLLTEQRADKIL